MKSYYQNENEKEKAIKSAITEFRKYDRGYVKDLCKGYNVEYKASEYNQTLRKLAEAFEAFQENSYYEYWKNKREGE